MSDDLQFGALHSDDALLDALGGRVPGASLSVAQGVTPCASEDVVARLLAAYAEEIDNRPGPLTELLRNPVPAAVRLERPLAAVDQDPTAAAGPVGGHPDRAPPSPPLGDVAHGGNREHRRTRARPRWRRCRGHREGRAVRRPASCGEFGDRLLALDAQPGPAGGQAAGKRPRGNERRGPAVRPGQPGPGPTSAPADRRPRPGRRTLRAELDALHRRWAAIEPALASVVSHGNPGKTSPEQPRPAHRHGRPGSHLRAGADLPQGTRAVGPRHHRGVRTPPTTCPR